MQFFKKFKQSGWAALKAVGGNICFTHVVRGEGVKPVVTAWISRPLDLQVDKAVETFVDEYSLNSRHCVAVLNRAEYQMLQVNAVTVPLAEAKQAVRWSIKDMLDYPVANATIDVLEIPFDSANPSRQRYMLAVAARNEVIRERIERFIDTTPTGLEAIDIAELGQRNIAALLEKPGIGLAMLSFSEEGGLLTFTSGGELYHSRQIDITVEQLQIADEDRRSAIYERVALDLQRSLDNFERQFSYVAVNRLLVAPFAMRAGFVDFLKSYLTSRVDTFELSDIFNLDSVPQLADVAVQPRAFAVLGVALREGA